jgi:ABC-type phosphate/phosphonate transport system substrate-binding protein
VTASLPMYDLPEIRAATNVFGKSVLRRLSFDGELARETDHEALWRDERLVFSQTCGYPLTHELAGQVRYAATPHYDADGCDGPLYRSLILARIKQPLESFRGARAAINAANSMSGMLALKLVFARLANNGKFFGDAIVTGSHLASMTAVRDGVADVCAIDAVTVALTRLHAPQHLDGLIEVARSPQAPGLPYITRARIPQDVVAALTAAFADDAAADARAALLLDGFSVLDDEAYDVIPRLEKSVADFKLL